MRLFLKLLGHFDAVSVVQSGKGKPVGAGAELVQRFVTIMASQPDDTVVVVWALAGRRARLNVDPMGSHPWHKIQCHLWNPQHHLEVVCMLWLGGFALLIVEASSPNVHDDTLQGLAGPWKKARSLLHCRPPHRPSWGTNWSKNFTGPSVNCCHGS